MSVPRGNGAVTRSNRVTFGRSRFGGGRNRHYLAPTAAHRNGASGDSLICHMT